MLQEEKIYVITLTEEQRAELQSALHYLLIKGELKQLQGISISENFFTNLRAIQTQVVSPLRIQ